MSGEILLILLVALVVFGPNKLPLLANHLGKLFHALNHLKQQLQNFWQQQCQEHQLEENTRKANEADLKYTPRE